MEVMGVLVSSLLKTVSPECEIAQRQVSAMLQLHENVIRLERDDENLHP